ncbi:MAG: lysylphosphatidylglycerol synthase transmembrane domain-containing protein [Solirubrobacterales bacterium]
MRIKVEPPDPRALVPLPQEGSLEGARMPAARVPLRLRARNWVRRHPTAVTLIGSTIVLAALAFGLWDKRADFTEALRGASGWVLAAAGGLQLVWLVARSEAWHVCVAAAGGSVERRRLYRASAVGYLGNIFNPNFGLAVRIAALRRSAPVDSPKPKVLIAAELPIVVVEIALAALLSFTLVGPLGVAWWIPLAVLAGSALVIGLFTRFLRDRREGFWKGLEVMRGLRSRNRIIALVIFAVSMQVARNWLVLEGLGVDISVLDSVALLIATAALGLLPVGPGLVAACAVMILGSNGVAVVAAAGALLTATGAAGSMCFAAWALADRLRRSPRRAAAGLPRLG